MTFQISKGSLHVPPDQIASLNLAVGDTITVSSSVGPISVPDNPSAPSSPGVPVPAIVPTAQSNLSITFVIPSKGCYEVNAGPEESFEFVVGHVPPMISIDPPSPKVGQPCTLTASEHVPVSWDTGTATDHPATSGVPQVLSVPTSGSLQLSSFVGGYQVTGSFTAPGIYRLKWFDETFSITVVGP